MLDTYKTRGNDLRLQKSRPVVVSNNMEKAEVLGNFFSSVFTIENELGSSGTPHRPYHSPFEQLSFNEQVILDKLHNLKITKGAFFWASSGIGIRHVNKTHRRKIGSS